MNYKKINENLKSEPKFTSTPNKSYGVDGKEIWVSRSVAVTMVIAFYSKQDDDYYIPMGKRGKACPDEVGKFSLPCGYLDYDETGSEAAFRETWEEIGLNLEVLSSEMISKTRGSYLTPYNVNDSPNSNRQNVTLNYGVLLEWDDSSQLPVLTNKYNEKEGEVDEIKYFSYHEYLKGASDEDVAFNHQNVVSNFLALTSVNFINQ